MFVELITEVEMNKGNKYTYEWLLIFTFVYCPKRDANGLNLICYELQMSP